MKRFIVVLMVLSIFIASPLSSFAATDGVNSVSATNGATYTYFEDGSYLVTTLTVVSDADLGASSAARATYPYDVTATQSGSYYDTADNLDWVVTLTAVFRVYGYTGSECLSSDITSKIYDSSWSMHNVDERCITNNAYGACDMKNKFLGITLQTVEVEITLTCDQKGNVTVPS